MLKTQEHIDLVAMFEHIYSKQLLGFSAAKETNKEMWQQGYIYCHGDTNAAFIAFRHGYAYGKAVHRSAAA